MQAARPRGARGTHEDRAAPLYREIARRRTGTPLQTRDVAEQVESLISELTRQGMDRAVAARLVARLAKEAALGP